MVGLVELRGFGWFWQRLNGMVDAWAEMANSTTSGVMQRCVLMMLVQYHVDDGVAALMGCGMQRRGERLDALIDFE